MSSHDKNITHSVILSRFVVLAQLGVVPLSRQPLNVKYMTVIIDANQNTKDEILAPSIVSRVTSSNTGARFVKAII